MDRRLTIWAVILLSALSNVAKGQLPARTSAPVESASGDSASPGVEATPLTLDELKAAGALRSSYQTHSARTAPAGAPQPQLETFRKDVQPVLAGACVRCHGPETQEGRIRIDALDPDLLHGKDVSWWLEVVAVLSNGEMPPADEPGLSDEDRSRVIDWLSAEIQIASTVRRAEQGYSTFRRMTRYEYNYALQDLLGLPFDFARDLPPESASEDGFENSSDMLRMSASQLATYRDLSLSALKKATVQGERPAEMYWGVTMHAASAADWKKQDDELESIRQQHKDEPDVLNQKLEQRTAEFHKRPNGTHYRNLTTGRAVRASWDYGGAKYAWPPRATRPEIPDMFDHVAIIPPRQKLIVELGDTIPEEGTLRVRVRASRASVENLRLPSLQLEFGWQASNDSEAAVRVSDHDLEIDAVPGQPKFYQWEIPLSEVHPRNSVRKVWKMGDLPSPSEYIRLVNSSVSQGDVQIDYVEITAPVYDQWPPASHTQVFFESANQTDESAYAREVLARFMSRAWRRPVTDSEVSQKLALFAVIRSECSSFQEAITEVLATVLASPKFLYLVRAGLASRDEVSSATDGTSATDGANGAEGDARDERLSAFELATRLSMFLWCSTPDSELLDLAADGRLCNSDVLVTQVRRMLDDPRSRRLSEHFVRQWLGLQLLDYLKVDRKVFPGFDPALKEAMLQEPTAFFQEALANNHSVIDFLHCDYTMVNERLADHYGISGVHGNHFRRVMLDPRHQRGGLLAQAGLLAMNSDGRDSHPLKRGIWILRNLLNDPPPPPPPAVPVIDLADPEIAKLTLKQRIENHRNQVACMSCHAKIDPWGIALENFDAIGTWRTEVDGKPADAVSQLFNGQELNGIDGLKRYLLEHRQDQFTRAFVQKMATFAVGRPLTFGDRSEVDHITAELRNQGDGLATLVTSIVTSELFQAR